MIYVDGPLAPLPLSTRQCIDVDVDVGVDIAHVLCILFC